MANKQTERIYIRIPADIKHQFSIWCSLHNVNASEFFRNKIEEALSADERKKVVELEQEVQKLKEEVRRLTKS